MAGTSVLKLTVDDKSYNASIKEARKGLLALEETLNKTGKSFNNADVQTFCKIYDGLSAEGIKNPAELYRKGIMKYLALEDLGK